ncbi:MAG: hypothetical protein PVG51_06310, partial [Desulfosarcina sp.]
AALPIWIDFMSATQREPTASYFDIPDNMSRVAMDPMTGLAVGSDHRPAVQALFVDGTEPQRR